jgi:lathosterol oxidase
MNLNVPVYSFPVTVLILSIVMVVRYFFLAGGFYLLTKRSKAASRKQMRREMLWSVISSLVFGFFGAVLIHAFLNGKTKIYFRIEEWGLTYLFLSLGLYLFIHDTYFYWTHRLLHLVKFEKVHYIHHESRIPTAWTSFAFHPVEALIQAIILPVLVFLIPIHWSMLVAFLLIMSVCGVINHLGVEFYPPFLEKKLKLISASHHQLHHQKVKHNFGLYFTFWDHWMNTEWERP